MDTRHDYSVSGVLETPIPTGQRIAVSRIPFGTKDGDWHRKMNTTTIITILGI